MPATPRDPSLTAYEALRQDRPELFVNDEHGDGIDILELTDAAGDTEQLGVVYSDAWIRLVRDPVRFPDGREGTYLRVLSTTDAPGVAVLPVLDGRFILLENYRHATRSWQLEIPRGFGTDGLTVQENALKELEEEISARIVSLTPIGAVHPDTGIQSQLVPLFLAELASVGQTETSAAIRRAVPLTKSEFTEGIVSGTITDGFTLAAFAQACVRSLV